MKTHKFTLFFSFLALALTLAAGWLVFVYRFWIYDQIIIAQNPPSAAARQLATDTSMTEAAATMFYGARADLSSSEQFQKECSGEEQTIVLGCYVGLRIYVLNVNDERIKEVEEVTAAHEMLHVAYERLSSTQKKQVNNWLDAAYERVKNQRLEELMQSYAKSEPGQHYNELHSILGTEYRDLGPDLEQYYRQFFADRLKIVAMTESYQGVFTNLKNQQEALVKELTELAQRIDQQTQSYNAELVAFNEDVADFNVRASAGSGNYNELNHERNQLLAQQRRLENLRADILAQRDEYETKRQQYNQLVLTSESLQSSLKGLPNPAGSL